MHGAKFGISLVGQGQNRLFFRDIAHLRGNAAAGHTAFGANLGLALLQLGRVDIAHQHAGARFDQTIDQATAYAASCARDDGYFSLKILHDNYGFNSCSGRFYGLKQQNESEKWLKSQRQGW